MTLVQRSLATLAITVAAFFWTSNSLASERDFGCKHNPYRLGRCHVVDGGYGLSGDSGMVLGRDDGGRTTVVDAAPHSARDIPDNLARALRKAQRENDALSIIMHGRFDACPIPSDEAHRYRVCLESARHLTAEMPGRVITSDDIPKAAGGDRYGHVFKPGPPLRGHKLNCTPKTVGSGDALTVTFRGLSTAELAVVAPNGELLRPTLGEEAGARRRGRPIASAPFSKGPRLRVKAADFSGLANPSFPLVRPIFRAPGVYMLIVGKQLHERHPIVDGWCKVGFVGPLK